MEKAENPKSRQYLIHSKMTESKTMSTTQVKELQQGKHALYQTQWVANDSTRDYPHGWGFTPPIIEMPRDIDPVFVGQLCREQLNNEEFSCIGVIQLPSFDGLGLLDYPRL